MSDEQQFDTSELDEADVYRQEVRAANRRKDLVIVNTGDGKEKSTAAFGMAFRAQG